MPLIARVMARAGTNSTRSTVSRSPPDPVASPACASASRRHAGSRSPPARPPSASPRSPPTPRLSLPPTIRCRWWRRSMRGTSMSTCRCSGRVAAPLWRRGILPLREALRAGGDRRAAPCRHRGEFAGCGLAAGEPRAGAVEQRAAPDIDWVARLGARRPTPARRPSRSTCARPMRSRKTPASWRADDAASSPIVRRAPSRCCRRRAARHRGDRRAAWRLVPARLERAGGRGACCSTAMCIAHRAMRRRQARRLHHVAHGGGRGGNPFGRGRRP